MLKRRFDKLLTEGLGRQLIWLFAIIIGAFILFWLISVIFFPEWKFGWQDIIALIIDGGNFSGAGEHDFFRLLIAFTGMFLFSALLISVFTNIFDNISEAVQKGQRRYKIKKHVIIFGAGEQLVHLLNVFFEKNSDKDVIVMTNEEIDQLKDRVRAQLFNPDNLGRIIFYSGERDNRNAVQSTCPQDATLIYILGEKEEQNRDSRNMHCADILTDLCRTGDHAIQGFLILEDPSAVDVNTLLDNSETNSDLHIEIINLLEYFAEIVTVYQGKDFLPVLNKESDKYARLVIFGTSHMARALAIQAAHVMHYPNFDGQRRSVITVIGKEMNEWMDDLIASRQTLFSLSTYEYISPEGEITLREPTSEYAPMIDIRWQFIDSHDSSPMVADLLKTWAADEAQEMCIAICHDDQQRNATTALHLPHELYNKNICVYLKHYDSLLAKANATGRFGHIRYFGSAAEEFHDTMFFQRTTRGIKVLQLLLGIPEDDYETALSAWYKASEELKNECLQCSNTLPLKIRCISPDDPEFFDMEHRRWMISRFLLNADTSYFEAPDDLQDEQYKLIVDNIHYIIEN